MGMYTKTELKCMSKDRLIEMYLDQQRQLERMADIAGAMASDGGIAERYQRERDELRDQQSSVFAFSEIQRSLLEDTFKQALDFFRASDGVPVQGQEWRRYEPFAIGLTNALIKRLDAELAQEFDASKRQIALVGRAGVHISDLAQKTIESGWLAQRWALYWIGFRWRMAVWKVVDKPEFLALNVIEIAEQGMLPDDELIARLCQTWENGPTPSRLLEALKTAIVWHQRKAHQTQVAVAQKLGIDDRTLRARLTLYEDLRELAASANIEDENLS